MKQSSLRRLLLYIVSFVGAVIALYTSSLINTGYDVPNDVGGSNYFAVPASHLSSTTSAGSTANTTSTTEISSYEKNSTMALNVVVAKQKNNPELRIGILSHQNISFFRHIQQQIDDRDAAQRCSEYGFQYNPNMRRNRRIFFGSNIADETWELLDIISTESYNVLSAVVLVESNRTPNLTPRPFRHLHDTDALQEMFNASVQIRTYIQESDKHKDLEYDHAQRQEILKGWKELGMLPDDVGYLGDTDEMFSRDFLRAVQTCEINQFKYNSTNNEIITTIGTVADAPFTGHFCQHQFTKVIGTTQVFESSPECITAKRVWHHPDMILGHCIDGIGDRPVAPRNKDFPFKRAHGYGSQCYDWDGENSITDPKQYPSWNAADFKRTCGGEMIRRKSMKDVQSQYTAYHFHNFFISFNQSRFKYLTYSHPDANVNIKRAEDMHADIRVMYRCAKNLPDSKDQKFKRVVGGYDVILPFQPIYFHDEDYRRRRHEHVQQMMELDDQIMTAVLQERNIPVAIRSTSIWKRLVGGILDRLASASI